MEGNSILVIEDNKNLLTMYTQLLKSQGLRVYSALTAHDGMYLAKINKPEVFLVDYKLPGMTGLDFCRFIRKDPELLHSILIISTGYEVSEQIIELFHDLADGWINKTDGTDVMLKSVMKWVNMVR